MKNKIFFIVNALIENEEGKILLVKRKREWHKEAHGKWELPGGKIEFNETPENTCVREAREESGLDVEIDYLIPKIHTGSWEYPDKKTKQIIICYKCDFVGGNISLEDSNVSDVKWFNLNEIYELDCLPGTFIFLDEYKDE